MFGISKSHTIGNKNRLHPSKRIVEEFQNAAPPVKGNDNNPRSTTIDFDWTLIQPVEKIQTVVGHKMKPIRKRYKTAVGAFLSV